MEAAGLRVDATAGVVLVERTTVGMTSKVLRPATLSRLDQLLWRGVIVPPPASAPLH